MVRPLRLGVPSALKPSRAGVLGPVGSGAAATAEGDATLAAAAGDGTAAGDPTADADGTAAAGEAAGEAADGAVGLFAAAGAVVGVAGCALLQAASAGTTRITNASRASAHDM